MTNKFYMVYNYSFLYFKIQIYDKYLPFYSFSLTIVVLNMSDDLLLFPAYFVQSWDITVLCLISYFWLHKLGAKCLKNYFMLKYQTSRVFQCQMI